MINFQGDSTRFLTCCGFNVTDQSRIEHSETSSLIISFSDFRRSSSSLVSRLVAVIFSSVCVFLVNEPSKQFALRFIYLNETLFPEKNTLYID